MDVPELARLLARNDPPLRDDLAQWMQKCRWAGLSGLQYPADFTLEVTSSHVFSILPAPVQYVLVEVMAIVRNPPERKEFCLIFAPMEGETKIPGGMPAPASGTFAPTIAQAQWSLVLAPLAPTFIESLCIPRSESETLLQAEDLRLSYVRETGSVPPPMTITEIKQLGGGDTTNFIVRATLEGAGGARMKVVFKSYLALYEPNIEAEVITHLHHAGFNQVPRLEGRLLLRQGARQFNLVLVSQFVECEGDGGKPFWEDLQRYFARSGQKGRRTTAPSAELKALARVVGRTTRALHDAMVAPSIPAFKKAKTTLRDLKAWNGEFRTNFTSATHLCTQKLPQLFPQLTPKILGEVDTFFATLERAVQKGFFISQEGVPYKQRIHGDMHLGQFLYQPSKPNPAFIVTDLEGDPQLPPRRRQEKRTTWYDLAGLLRALDYIAFFGVREFLNTRAPRREWSLSDVFQALYAFQIGTQASPELEKLRAAWQPLVSAAREWVSFTGQKILEGYGTAEPPEGMLASTFKLVRATSELNYELKFRGQNALVPLLGVMVSGQAWLNKGE